MKTFTNRTNASILERILQQPFFDVGNVTGQNVLLIDDHVNAGGFSKTLASQAADAGAKVIGIATFSTHPHSRTLNISPEIKEFLTDLYPERQINILLQPIGLSVDSLSNREGLTLIAILIDGRNKDQMDRFQSLERNLCSEYGNIASGISDNIYAEARKPAETLLFLKQHMDKKIETRSAERMAI